MELYLIQLRKHRPLKPLGNSSALREILPRPFLELLRKPEVELERKLFLRGVVAVGEPETGVRFPRHVAHRRSLVSLLREERERRPQDALPRAPRLGGQRSIASRSRSRALHLSSPPPRINERVHYYSRVWMQIG